MKDYVIRAVDKDRSFRVFVASTTNMIEDARRIHHTSATATAALGRAMTATAIMGVMLKSEREKVSLQFKGDGPIRTILTVGNSKGEVKGYVGVPEADLPLNQNGKLDVGGIVGRDGKLVVIRDFGLKEPYIGQSRLTTGEIGDGLAHYFATSEQQPSAVALGVLIEKDLSVKASGGMIIQVLPNISDENLSELEYITSRMTPMSTLIDQGYSPEKILEGIFEKFDMEIVEKVDLSFTCDCSEERMERALISIGKKDLKEILEEDKGAELTCHFCDKKYQFDEEKLEDLLKQIEA